MPRTGPPSPEAIQSTSWDGNKRWLLPRACSFCGKVKYFPKHQLGKNNYCSQACSSQARTNRVTRQCAWCKASVSKRLSKIAASRSGLVFCNRNCKERAQELGGIEAIQPDHYGTGTGIHTYREKTLRNNPRKCCRCGYSEQVKMLDVHHKDGNRENNQPDNLEVLCVWCHALETRKVEPHRWSGKGL